MLTRVARPTTDGRALAQDVVYVIDTTGTVPRDPRVAVRRRGRPVHAQGGLNPQYSGPRLDFNTITILPSGRIATGYFDTTTGGPANVAVEQEVRRGRGGAVR